eukprot:1009124-Rhodomonas_salina.1
MLAYQLLGGQRNNPAILPERIPTKFEPVVPGKRLISQGSSLHFLLSLYAHADVWIDADTLEAIARKIIAGTSCTDTFRDACSSSEMRVWWFQGVSSTCFPTKARAESRCPS